MKNFQNITKERIIKTINSITNIPAKYQSTEYDLLYENKTYPIKYVLTLAGATGDFNSTSAKTFLQSLGFTVVSKSKYEYCKYTLTITANNITSTDKRFTMNDLTLGDNYTPLKVYFESADNKIIERQHNKRERSISNQTLPKLAFQIYNKEINNLSKEERLNFPICSYKNSETIKGIFDNIDEYKKNIYSKSILYMEYKYDKDKKYVIYCWNIFSTLIFIQECLKRFGKKGDKFILTYRQKTKNSDNKIKDKMAKTNSLNIQEFTNPYSKILFEAKNIIFRGAPGTGKTYLAKTIAADIVSKGYFQNYNELDEEQKSRIGFVQFHPSYDYTDFVEGIRPVSYNDEMKFELQDGIFKKFIDKARENYEKANKEENELKQETKVDIAIKNFLENTEFNSTEFTTKTNNLFYISDANEKNIYVYIPNNPIRNNLIIKISRIKELLKQDKNFNEVKDIVEFFNQKSNTQENSYEFSLYLEIKKLMNEKNEIENINEELKYYVFIIDEINRGDISKIFGELFFAIDPNYRGQDSSILTQYSNMHEDPEQKFYIPENVFIIGTMNDIDRSVDTFDFAMHRRFRFIELKADDCTEMLYKELEENLANEAIKRMNSLNEAIKNNEELNENYQIGPAYFLKLKTLSFDELWLDYLKPLLKEYVEGTYNEKEDMEKFALAYGYQEKNEENNDN